MANVTCSNDLMNRPGGFIITDRAITFCGFMPGAGILDIGCGTGATVRHLAGKYQIESTGIDIELPDPQNNLFIAPADVLPFPTATFNGVLMECCLSLMKDQSGVLKESLRVLKPGGYLMVSDMYARGEPACLEGTLGRLDTKDEIISLIEKNSFEIIHFEDFTIHLQSLWGQMIMDKGAASFYCSLGAGPELMKRVKCGYFLVIARKKEDSI
jgi:arsenite methyltransferase